MAPLQKRALLILLVGSIFTVALVAAFLLTGDVNAFNRDESLRWLTYAALVGVPLAYLILVNLTLHKPAQLDERDRLIILRSGRMQWLAVAFSLAAWMIALIGVHLGIDDQHDRSPNRCRRETMGRDGRDDKFAALFGRTI